MAGPNRGQRKAASAILYQAATPQWMESPPISNHRRALRCGQPGSTPHLGTAGCNAELLLTSEVGRLQALYLVGDIIDDWAEEGLVLATAAQRYRAASSEAKHGTRVIYVPGNHEGIRGLCRPQSRGASAGARSHPCDGGRTKAAGPARRRVRRRRAHAEVARLPRRQCLHAAPINHVLNWVRRKRGCYWSLSSHLKEEGEERGQFISSFEGKSLPLLRHERSRGRLRAYPWRRSGRSAT
jgi:hypothetical protein